VLAAGAVLTSSGVSFASGASARTPRSQRQQLRAESAVESPASESVALVKVTEESKMTTASILGGLAGLLVGGVWVGAAVFAGASYYARKGEDDDITKTLKSVAASGLEVVNFGAAINEKYTVTDKLGSAISGALEGAKSGENKEAVSTVTGALAGVKDAIQNLDNEIGIKDTLGNLATSASELAAQAVDKAVELNKEYKVTDQISAKIEEVTKSK